MDGKLQCILEDTCRPFEATEGTAQTLLTCSKAQLTKKMISSKHQKMLRQKQAQLALQKQHEEISRSWHVTAQHDIALPSAKLPHKVLSRELLASFADCAQREEMYGSLRQQRDPIGIDSASMQQSSSQCDLTAPKEHAKRSLGDGIEPSKSPQMPSPQNSSNTTGTYLQWTGSSSEDAAREMSRNPDSTETPKSSGGLVRMRSVPGSMRFPCPSPCRNFKLWDSLKRPRGSARVTPLSQQSSQGNLGIVGSARLLEDVSPKGARSPVRDASPKSTLDGSLESIDGVLADCVLEDAAIDID